MNTNLPTIRCKITIVVLACILPSLVGFAFLISYFFNIERHQLDQDAIQTARALTAVVDSEVRIGENIALALATSPYLASGDLAAFHAQAKSLLRDDYPGTVFTLSDATGQQRANTLVPFGTPLPRHGNPEQLRRVFETGKPVLSDLYIGGVLHRPLCGIDVPVWRDGNIIFVLSVGFTPEQLSRILVGQRLATGRIASVLDTTGKIVARTHQAERFVGQLGVPALVRQIREATEGTLEAQTLEGIPAFFAFSRSTTTGWTVAIAIPTATVLNQLLRSVSVVTLCVSILLGSGFIAAWVLGGRIGRSVQALIAPVLALGKGVPAPRPPQPDFREAVEVATALITVEGELEAHRHHLETLVAERTAALSASRSRLEQILQAVGEGIFGTDADLRLIFANQAAADLLGMPSPESLLGVTAEGATHHQSADGTLCTQASCAIRHTVRDSEIRRVPNECFQKADGTVFPVEYVVAPLVIDHRAIGAVVVFSDVSQRRATERVMRERQDVFEQMFVTGSSINLLLDPVDGRIVDANPAAADFYGYPLEQFRHMTIFQINVLPPDIVTERMLQARDRQCGYFQMDHRLSDGSLRTIETYSGPLCLRDRVLLLSNIHDVTERVKNEHRLAEALLALKAERRHLAASRDFVGAILDSLGSHIAILDADGTITKENRPWRAFAQSNGLPPHWTGVGMNYFNVCEAAAGSERACALAASAGIRETAVGLRDEFTLDYPCDSPDQKRWFHMRVTPLKGHRDRLVVCHDDISDLKAVEAALRESEDRLALATRGAHIGIWDWNIATDALLGSDEIYAQWGRSPNDPALHFSDFRTLIHADDRDRFDWDIQKALQGKEPFDSELKVVLCDGNLRHLKCSGQVFCNNDGAPVRMVGISYDITENKRFERRLNELFDFNQKIINECPVGIVAFKATGACVLANEAYARIMGGSLDEVRASNFLELATWRENGFRDIAKAALANGAMRHASAHHVTQFGREVWAEAFFVPFSSGGEPHLLCIKSDVTEQVKSQEQLAAARDRAESASRAKSEFVANMSHEIRTPMNAIIGLSRLLEDSFLGERERDYVAKIKISARSLLGILNDILDFSKIEAGRLELEHNPFSLDDVLRSISAMVATTAKAKGLETIFSVGSDVPLSLVGDSLRLQQVLLNLAGNAVKWVSPSFPQRRVIGCADGRQQAPSLGYRLPPDVSGNG